ncbi:MAG: hypothetical protein WCN88_04780 [Candidatus Falkowbacteria bacterium]
MRELNINERNQILETINTPGWKVIESVIGDEVFKLLNPINVDKTIGCQEIAADVIGRSYATIILNDVVKRVNDLKIKNIVVNKPMI